ncbi:MAG: flippase-like domain-containing protein [Cytophagales bacterium]|nr:flippase-like domain-containing protein [Cytophagales bacterium]
MSKQIINTISYIFFLGLGVYLMFYTFRNLELPKVLEAFEQANFWWFIPILISTICCHLLRAFRWQLLLKSVNYPISLGQSFRMMMAGYFVSYGVPRLGEVTRCMALQKDENIPFTVSFGTVVVERLADLIFIIGITAATFFIEYDLISTFFSENIFQPLLGIFTSSKTGNNERKYYILGALAILTVLYYILKPRLEKSGYVEKADQFSNDFLSGIQSVSKMDQKGLFALLSILIWVFYFLMTFFWFYSLGPTSHLGIKAGLALLVIGTVGRSVPIQGGGMGAYHYLITKGLLLFGVAELYGSTLAIIIHGAQTLFTIGVGGICFLLILTARKKKES